MRSFEFARKIENDTLVVKDGQAQRAYDNAQIPEYQTSKSAGADFFAAEDTVIPSIWKSITTLLFVNRESLRIFAPMQTQNNSTELKSEVKKSFSPTIVHTGIKASMEEDEVLELYNRSSNPKKLGLILANSVGVVDADYYNNKDNDGEIMFAFYNILPCDITIKAGTRIGQGVFKKYLRPTKGLRVKQDIRSGGFGSTKE